jgi:hypothetical protein
MIECVVMGKSLQEDLKARSKVVGDHGSYGSIQKGRISLFWLLSRERRRGLEFGDWRLEIGTA